MADEAIKPAGPCLRCGYGPWWPRKPGRPTLCASQKCKSPYWDKPRSREVKPKKQTA